MKNKKVYCKNCEYLYISEYNNCIFRSVTAYTCHAPQNTIEKNTWLKKEVTGYIEKPCELNKNNDCKYFEEPYPFPRWE
jgi:hypothetical protein